MRRDKFCLLIAGFIFFFAILGHGRVVDLQMHDTYFVLGVFQIGCVISFMFLFNALQYYLLSDVRLFHCLSFFHLASAVFSGLSIIIIAIFEPLSFIFNSAYIVTLTLVFIVSQIVALLNFSLSWIFKK